jgi:O-antigen/teichoic acid export membrane protein
MASARAAIRDVPPTNSGQGQAEGDDPSAPRRAAHRAQGGASHRLLRRASHRAPRKASHRVALTTIDQGFSSASNFLVGAAAARLGGVVDGAKALGAFSFAYVCWLLLAAMHRALVTDPMAIENDAWQSDAPARLRTGLAAELTLGLTAAGLFVIFGIALLLAGQKAFGTALLAFVPWLVPLVVQDYWRWVGFMQKRPGKALANDTVFNVAFGIVLVVLVLTHSHSVVELTASWGVGALAGALFGLWQFSVRPTGRGGVRMLRSRLHISKWLGGNSALAWGATQATSLVIGFILGPVGLGYLKAAQTLVYGPTLVLIQAGGSVGLPEASASLANHGWPGLRRVARVVTGAGMLSVGLVGAIVLLFGSRLLGLIYGAKFSHYWLSSDLFALSVLVSSMTLGAILILKASRRTRGLFVVSIVSLVGSLLLASILATVYGVIGAAVASIPSAALNLVGLFYFKRLARIDLARE